MTRVSSTAVQKLLFGCLVWLLLLLFGSSRPTTSLAVYLPLSSICRASSNVIGRSHANRRGRTIAGGVKFALEEANSGLEVTIATIQQRLVRFGRVARDTVVHLSYLVVLINDDDRRQLNDGWSVS